MVIRLEINDIDRTSNLLVDSFEKEDHINEIRDTVRFQILKYGEYTYEPSIGEEVKFYVDDVKVFGGIITNIEKTKEGGEMILISVLCVDYSHLLDRQLVVERYDNKSPNEIIADIIAKYAPDFTMDNVDCSTKIKTIIFPRLPISECLRKMAETVGYFWYVDEKKDIHFFARDDNPAPFSITDETSYWDFKLLKDLSQLKNRVVIKGGEERGEERTESYEADGEQLIFSLAHKFAEKPVVKVNDVEQNVGIDFLDKEEDFDCFWNYTEKYIRFTISKKPAKGDIVAITGIPLFPVLVRISDWPSIQQYGIFEFFKEDKSIKSREEALNFARVELEAYKNGIIECEFKTDQHGLRSGQIIQVESELMGINESFLIQSVTMRILSEEKTEYHVRLASMRTIGVINFFQELLRRRDLKDLEPENLLSYFDFGDECQAVDSISEPSITSPPYYWWPDEGEGENPPILWNKFTWVL